MIQKRILIVDDEENFRHMLSVILKREGYDVETASNGEEGLQKISLSIFDQILCDIRMPQMDGLEFLRRENEILRKEVQKEYSFQNIISKNEKMQKIFEVIRKVAQYKSTILIMGESGTGKELIARALHYNSDRSQNPFIAINCGAIPENLLETELFGHIKGA